MVRAPRRTRSSADFFFFLAAFRICVSALTVLDTLPAFPQVGIFVFGIVMALLGAVVPVLVITQLAFGLEDVGLLFLVMNGAMLVASLLVGPATDRVGMKGPIALGALPSWAWRFSWRSRGPPASATCFRPSPPLGFGGGALNAGAKNTLEADLHDNPETQKAAALNLLIYYFGIGALLLPLSIGALLARAGLAGPAARRCRALRCPGPRGRGRAISQAQAGTRLAACRGAAICSGSRSSSR